MTIKRRKPPPTQPDTGYAWVVLVAATIINVSGGAFLTILAILLVEFLQHFDVNPSTISLLGAVHMGSGAISGFFIGPLIRYYGTRVVAMSASGLITVGLLVSGLVPRLPVIYVFYGVCTSIGMTTHQICGVVALQKYFDRWRALATGIFMTGVSVGVFAIPPLLQTFIASYGWQGAMILMAGGLMHSVVPAALLRPFEDNVAPQLDTKDGHELPISQPAALLCFKPRLLLYYVGCFFNVMGHQILFTYTPVRCSMIGLSKREASLLLTVMGSLSIFGRPLFGLIGDYVRSHKITLIGLSAILCGALGLLTIWLDSFWELASVYFPIGIFVSSYSSLEYTALADLAGINHVEVASGIFLVVISLSALVVHVSAGYILDYTGDPSFLFLLFSSSQVLGGLVILSVALIACQTCHSGSRPGSFSEKQTSLSISCPQKPKSNPEYKEIKMNSDIAL